MKPSTPQNPKLALAVTKAIGYTENGGAPDIKNPSAGKSGELASIFQFEPGTWKAVAGKYLGNPNAPLTADNETIAETARVSDWLDQGYTPEQIFSMQNAGPGEPDAYTGKFSDGSSSTGTNKYGVQYNVPSYVQKGMKYLSEFEPEMSQKVAATPTGSQSNTSQDSDLLSTVLSKLQNTNSSIEQPPQTSSPGMLPPANGIGPQIPGMLAGPQKVT